MGGQAGIVWVEAEGLSVVDGRVCIEVGENAPAERPIAVRVYNRGGEDLELASPPFLSNAKFELVYPPPAPRTIYLGRGTGDYTPIEILIRGDGSPQVCEVKFHGRLRPSLARGTGSIFILTSGAEAPAPARGAGGQPKTRRLRPIRTS